MTSCRRPRAVSSMSSTSRPARAHAVANPVTRSPASAPSSGLHRRRMRVLLLEAGRLARDPTGSCGSRPWSSGGPMARARRRHSYSRARSLSSSRACSSACDRLARARARRSASARGRSPGRAPRNSWPTMRHQGGRSSATVGSTLRISSTPPSGTCEHVLADEQHEARAAVEVAAVEDVVAARRGARLRPGPSQYATQGEPFASHSTRAAPPAGVAPSTSMSSVMPRFFMHGEQTRILPPPFDELVDQILQRREGLALVDLVDLALDRGPDAVGAQEHHGVLLAAQRGVGHDEAHGGLVAVALALGDRDAERVRHDVPFVQIRCPALAHQVEGRVRVEEGVPGEPAPGRDLHRRAGVATGDHQQRRGRARASPRAGP